MATKPRDFNELLQQAIDETLNNLGTTISQSIYNQIKNQYNLNPQDIPLKIEQFQESIEAIFGTGAQFIEILIIQNLFEKTGLPAVSEKDDNMKFVEYINLSRRRFKA
jgi:hypothetical protein